MHYAAQSDEIHNEGCSVWSAVRKRQWQRSNNESPAVTTSWIFEEHPWDQRLENGAMASVVSGCRINFGVEAVLSWFTALQVRLGASLLNKQAGFALAVDTMWVRQVSSLCSLLACAWRVVWSPSGNS